MKVPKALLFVILPCAADVLVCRNPGEAGARGRTPATYSIVRLIATWYMMLSIVLLGVSICFLGACGKKSGSGDAGQDATVASNANAELSEEEAIEEMLNVVLTRLRYGDKSGLYESEFDYFTDETDFDEYLTMGQIRAAQADTINFVEVRNIEFFDRDSAIAEVTVHFEGPTGKKSYFDDKIILYYHKGRWIKPTVTVIDLQLDYEEKIRTADSAAAAEAEELD